MSSVFKKIVQVLTVVIFVTVGIRIFLVDSFIVEGNSMAPTILSGDVVFVYKRAYEHRDPQHQEVVVANFRQGDMEVIKRVIGLPKDWLFITPDDVSVSSYRGDLGTPLEEDMYVMMPQFATNGTSTRLRLDPNEYFLMGDNRAVSYDSREFGPVDRWAIKGRVFLLFRISALSLIEL